jgi:uncharacterized protein YndB with AHSA1/START domain
MTVIRHIAAPRQRVWEVLADGWTYSQWVVGNSRIRAVDEDWPAPGSTIHHTIGLWPLAINDETLVEHCAPLEELVLLATATPFAAARITLRLADVPDGCRVEMREVPASWPLRYIPDRLALVAAWPRNRECLSRLASLIEHRSPEEVRQQ